jgi:hypothetical protein
MDVVGSSTPSFSATIAGSFQVVIVPAKIPAMVAADMLRVSMPSRLKMTAMGEMYSGSCTMPLSGAQEPQPAAAISSSSNARSLPAKSTPPARNASRPAPDPEGS